MSRRLLFVDDEPNVLGALQRILRPLHSVWEMKFVTSGAEALQAMDTAAYDAVVSDMKMPGMSGAELLEEVRRRYPASLRFVLSGESDRETALRAANAAHQFLAKPCEAEELKESLIQACALRDILVNPKLKEVISQITVLPSIPSLYTELLGAIDSPMVSNERIGQIIERDMGMTLKMLKLANSALFGFRSRVSNAAQAVGILGTETIKALVLTIGVFSDASDATGLGDRLRGLWEHSLRISRLSRKLAHLAGANAGEIENSLTAGLLHDVGKLVIAWKLPEQWREIESIAQAKQISMLDAEYECLGCSHAEIGAYLMGSWSLPMQIIDAVAWHHHPSASLARRLSPLLFVHLAHSIPAPQGYEGTGSQEPIDQGFLKNCGIGPEHEEWIRLAQEFESNSSLATDGR